MNNSQDLWSNQGFSRSQDYGYQSLGGSMPLSHPNPRKPMHSFNSTTSMNSCPLDLQVPNNFSNSWTSGMSKGFCSQSALPSLSYQGGSGKLINENEIRVRHALHAMLTVMKSLPNKVHEVIENSPVLKTKDNKIILDAMAKLLKENLDQIREQLTLCIENTSSDYNLLTDLCKQLSEDKCRTGQKNKFLEMASCSSDSFVNSNRPAMRNDSSPEFTFERRMGPHKRNRYPSHSPVAWVMPQRRETCRITENSLRDMKKTANNFPPKTLDILEFGDENSLAIANEASFDLNRAEQNEKNTRDIYYSEDIAIVFTRPQTRLGRSFK